MIMHYMKTGSWNFFRCLSLKISFILPKHFKITTSTTNTVSNRIVKNKILKMIFLQSYNRISHIDDIGDYQIGNRHKNKCPFENLKIGIVCKLAEQHGYRIFKFVRCLWDKKSRIHDQNLACHHENLQFVAFHLENCQWVDVILDEAWHVGRTINIAFGNTK